jgi:hypothetical protein
MKILATRGDVYSFAGTPVIKYVAECTWCGTRGRKGFGCDGFTELEARDKWVTLHEKNPKHCVTLSTEVTA